MNKDHPTAQKTETKPEQREMEPFVISRVFDAPREKVWQAWTASDQVKHWWGPKGFTAPTIKLDFQEGGKYLYDMRSPEGKDYWSTGTFQEIVPMKKVVVTDSFADEKGNVVSAEYYGMDAEWPIEMTLEVTFEDSPDGTKFILKYPDMFGVKADALIDMYQGWNESLDKLAKHLAKGK